MAMNYRIYVDTGNAFAELPVPSAMSYGLQDISSSNAGRTESTMTMKERLGKAPKINLTYANRDTSVVTTALALVANEYTNILYQDLENGGVYTYGQFYRGDVTAEVYNGALDIWSATQFSLIKRSGANGVPCLSHTTQTSTSESYSTSALGTVANYTIIHREGGAIGLTLTSTNTYAITPAAGAKGTIIFRNASNQTMIVEVDA